MNKSLRFVIIFVLAFHIFIPLKTSSAADSETSLLKNDTQGLKLDFNSLSEYRAEKGLRNLEPYSLTLINKGLKAYGEKREEETVYLLKQAKELSPDLPLPYLYLARINFSLSSVGFSSASGYLIEAWKAFINNFRWSFQTAGMLSISLFLAFYTSIIVFLVAVISTKLRLYIHDVAEDKRKIFFLLPSGVLIFLGPILGLIGFIFPFWKYIKRKERVLVSSSIVIVLVLVFAAPMVSLFINGLQDKTLQNVVKINEGFYTGDTLEIPESGRGYEAAFAEALNLKRKGYYNEAIAVYKELLEKKEDAKVYNNLADAYIGLGNNDMAMSFYDRALRIKKMASTYFNLSQIYREKFDFNNAKEFYLKAMEIDLEKVTFYNSVKGITANRFVMDETFDNKELWKIVFQRSQYDKSIGKMLSFLNREFSIILILFLTIALYASDKYIPSGAYRCKRCGEIHCGKCERKISRDDVCHACHKTLVRVGELTPQERVEKILEIQHHKNRRNQNLKVLTLIFPGIGHIYYGWTVSGFIRLFLSCFFSLSTVLWLYIPTPVSMNILASVIKWMSAAGLIIVYVSTVMNIFRRVP